MFRLYFSSPWMALNQNTCLIGNVISVNSGQAPESRDLAFESQEQLSLLLRDYQLKSVDILISDLKTRYCSPCAA